MSSFGDLILDFDLDYLHQNSTPSVVPSGTEKQKRAVLIAKKKTVATDSLIRKYYETRETAEKLERNLFEAKDECKQIWIDYTNSLQRISMLEEKEQQLTRENGELREGQEMSENRYQAIQSHAHQLQLLAKENTIKIEAMEIESRLEKANTKKLEMKVASLEKERALLHEHIHVFRDIILGKKKVDPSVKLLMKKYKGDSDKEEALATRDVDKCSDRGSSPALDDEFESCDEEELSIPKKVESADVKASYPSQDITKEHRKRDLELYSDSSNDVVSSVDTGRGSSLGLTDRDKSILSPEYCSNNADIILDNIVEYENSHGGATAVLITIEPEEEQDKGECDVTLTGSADVHEHRSVEMENDNGCAEAPNAMSDTKTCPKDATPNINHGSVCTSVSIFDPVPVKTVPTTKTNETQINNISKDVNECLKQNSSEIVNNSKEIRDDMEITSILDTMTLRLKLITPIPCSPSTVMTSTIEHAPHECVEAAKIREENKALRESIANLATQVLEIKSLLKVQVVAQTNNCYQKDQHEITEKPSKYNKSPCTKNIIEQSTEDNDNVVDYLRGKKEDNRQLSPVKDPEAMEEPYDDLFMIPPHLLKPTTVSSNLNKDDNNYVSSDSETEEMEEPSDDLIIGPPPSTQANISSNLNKGYNSRVNHDRDTKKMEEPSDELIIIPPPSTHTSVSSNLNKGDNSLVSLDRDTEEMEEPSDDLIIIPPPSTPANVSSNLNKEDNNRVSLDRDTGEMEEPSDALIILPEVISSVDKNIEVAANTPDKSCIDKLAFVEPLVSINHESNDHTVSGTTEGVHSECNQILNNDDNSAKIKRKGRLTKLEKMRNRLVPKSKIKAADASPPKILRCRNILKPISNSKSANMDILNNKAIYDKALAVVKEIRAKQNDKKDTFIRRENLSRNCKTIAKEKDAVDKKPSEKASQKSISSEIAEDDKEPPVCDIKRRKRSYSILSTDGVNGERTVTTRSLAKQVCTADSQPKSSVKPKSINNNQTEQFDASPVIGRLNNRKRSIDDMQNNTTRRKLRSASVKSSVEPSHREIENDVVTGKIDRINNDMVENKLDNKTTYSSSDKQLVEISRSVNISNLTVKDYSDMDLFTDSSDVAPGLSLPKVGIEVKKNVDGTKFVHPKESIICQMIEKYGIKTTHKHQKLPEKTIENVSKKLETDIETISHLQTCEAKGAMNNLVDHIKSMDYKCFLMGLLHYMKQPERKTDLFSKTCLPPAPPMSKIEQILIYIITQLKTHWPDVDIVDDVMRGIEWTLFRLNSTPDTASVEALAHAFAVLARLARTKMRLRMFVLDAMYCLNFKAVPLIRQCIDVWMHIIPLAHLGLAQSPLVMCLVYLLHFFKCEDRDNRVVDIRNILQKRYSYTMSDWNDNRILQLLKNAILELREIPIEKKMLRTSLVILGKRKGPQWCQKHVIRGLLLPIIENKALPERARNFCLTTMGPLLKPFPMDMKVNSEIFMNQLINMFKETDSQPMKEAIISSLLLLSKHSQYSVLSLLLTWKPQTAISRELDEALRDFVREKPVKVWAQMLSKHSVAV